ncbi:MAG: winged helix-turn-helix domain-containing protein [Candidatus Micrarchaeota archaeon]
MGGFESCPIVNYLHVFELKGAVRVLQKLNAGHTRFTELKTSSNLNPQLLSRRLKDLGEAGLIQQSGRTSYLLTEEGKRVVSCWQKVK